MTNIRGKTIKRKTFICGLAIIALAGLSSCGLHSNYESDLKEANSSNAVMKETDSAPVVDLTGPSPDWTEEVLMSLFANRNELAIRVGSGGCTQKDDFLIWHQIDDRSNAGQPHYLLTIYRVRKDECKAIMRNGIEIKYHLKEDLGLPNIFTYTLTNRIGRSPYAR